MKQAKRSGRLSYALVTATIIVGFTLAYWIWPKGIFERPLAEADWGTLLQAGAAILVAAFSIGMAFIA
jgi:hypothetical protein